MRRNLASFLAVMSLGVWAASCDTQPQRPSAKAPRETPATNAPAGAGSPVVASAPGRAPRTPTFVLGYERARAWFFTRRWTLPDEPTPRDLRRLLEAAMTASLGAHFDAERQEAWRKSAEALADELAVVVLAWDIAGGDDETLSERADIVLGHWWLCQRLGRSRPPARDPAARRMRAVIDAPDEAARFFHPVFGPWLHALGIIDDEALRESLAPDLLRELGDGAEHPPYPQARDALYRLTHVIFHCADYGLRPASFEIASNFFDIASKLGGETFRQSTPQRGFSQTSPPRDAKPERSGTRVLRDERGRTPPARDALPFHAGTRELRDVEKTRARWARLLATRIAQAHQQGEWDLALEMALALRLLGEDLGEGHETIAAIARRLEREGAITDRSPAFTARVADAGGTPEDWTTHPTLLALQLAMP